MSSDDEHYREMMRIIDRGNRQVIAVFIAFCVFALAALAIGLTLGR